MNYILHIDTSSDKGIVAISCDGTLIASRINEQTRNHAGTINLMINEIIDEAKISLDELSAVAVCAGPGSYTGLRIGVATAKGLCYALDKPLMLNNRLTLLAYAPYYQGEAAKYFTSLLLARDKEYFISIYNNDFKCLLEPQHIIESQLNEIFEKTSSYYVITDVSETIINSMSVSNLQIYANTQLNLNAWANYAFERYKCNDIVNLSLAEPFYLKQVYTHN